MTSPNTFRLSELLGLLREFNDVERSMAAMEQFLERQWGDKDEGRVAKVRLAHAQEEHRFHELDTVLLCYRADCPDVFTMAVTMLRSEQRR